MSVTSIWCNCKKEIADGTTVDVDGTITVPDGCDEVIIRITAGNVVGAIGMMTDILIESADTYAIAAGGGCLPGFFTASTAPY